MTLIRLKKRKSYKNAFFKSELFSARYYVLFYATSNFLTQKHSSRSDKSIVLNIKFIRHMVSLLWIFENYGWKRNAIPQLTLYTNRMDVSTYVCYTPHGVWIFIPELSKKERVYTNRMNVSTYVRTYVCNTQHVY